MRIPTCRSFTLASFVCLLTIAFAACDEGAPTSLRDVLDPGATLESMSMDIGPEGGSIALKNGATLTIPAGALTSTTTVTWASLKEDDFFTGKSLKVYELLADVVPATATLRFAVAAGRSFEDFSLFNYNPVFDEEPQGKELPFTYDSSAGVIVTTFAVDQFAGGGARKSAGIKRTRVLVGDEPLVEPTLTQKIIAMPFYQQDAKTCYATCVKMLAKGYAPSNLNQVHDILKWIDYPETTGPNAYMYRWHMPTLIRRASGKSASGGQYWWARSAFNNLIARLDEGSPVVISRMGHSIMVIGYKKSQPLKGPAAYEYLVHDPSGDYAPNTWKNWDWLFQRSFDFQTFVEVWIPEAPPANTPLQTVGLPLTAATGRIEFLETNVDTGEDVPLVSMEFNKSTKSGYGWKQRAKWVTQIPAEASKLRLQLPLRNADSEKDANVMLYLKVAQRGTGGGFYQTNQSFTLPRSGARVPWQHTVALTEFFKPAGDTTCTMTVELTNSTGETIDKFVVDFVLAPAQAEFRIIRETGNATPANIDLILPTEVEFGKSYKIRGTWEDVASYPDAQYSILGGFVSDENDLEKEFWVQAVFRDKFVDLKGFHHYFDSNIDIPDTDKTRKYFKLQTTLRAYNANDANAPYWLQTRIYKIPIKR